jgi:uncharacterized protein (TIGR02172 family)
VGINPFLQNGPIAEGRTAEIYPWEAGWVLKLFRTWVSPVVAEDEAKIARAVHAAGLPAPAVGELVEVSNRTGIMYEKIEGPTLFEYFLEKPARLVEIARILADLHLQIHQVPADGLPLLSERLREKIIAGQGLSAQQKENAVALLERLPGGDRLCHGDFHPGNILMAAKGPVIIDWLDAAQGHPLGDVARSALLAKGAGLPPPGPGRVIMKLMRTAFLRIYLSRYFRSSPYDRQDLQSWYTLAAAGRLSESIEEEEAWLVGQAEAGLSQAAV